MNHERDRYNNVSNPRSVNLDNQVFEREIRRQQEQDTVDCSMVRWGGFKINSIVHSTILRVLFLFTRYKALEWQESSLIIHVLTNVHWS
jgi:hypothetical protein